MAEVKTEKIRLGTGDLTVSPYSTLTSGSAAPNNANGIDGDIYVRVSGSNSEIFIKKSGVWIPAGSGNAGTGGDYGLDSLVYNASFADDFSSSTNSATDGIQISITNATHAGGQYYTVSYEAFDGITKTISGVGTAVTLSAAPAFTVAVGDVIVYSNEARKIVTVTDQQTLVIESAFSTNPTAAAGMISQAVHTIDINNYNNGGTEAPISQIYTDSIGDLILNYNDATSGNIPDTTSNPKVSFTASASGVPSDYTLVTSRTGLTDTKMIVSLPTANTSLYLRFFACPSLSGAGTVNLLNYEAFFHNSATTISGGFALNQAYCFTDSSTTPINCNQPTVVSSKTRITGLPSYTTGINSGTVNGQLEVFINGQKIPRYVAGSTSPGDAFYNEITTDTIELDSDYSGYNYSVEVIRPVSVIDISGQAAQLSNPVGTVLTYAGSSAPTGYLLCHGQTLNAVTNPEYSALYSVIQNTYGGTNNTNFKVPDCQGVFIRGAGSQTIGAETYTSAALGIPQNDGTATNGLSTSSAGSHDHGGSTGSSSVPFTRYTSGGTSGNWWAGENGVLNSTPINYTLTGSSHAHSISSDGSHVHPFSSTDTETRPANIALNYIIKY